MFPVEEGQQQMRAHGSHPAQNDGRARERGMALITTMLIMMLMSALTIGFTAAVMSDQTFRSNDRDRQRAFYAAQSGIEKLNADLAMLFFANVSPSTSQIAELGLASREPEIEDVTFANASGLDPYGITVLGSSNGTISTGPYQGLIALKTTYDLTSSVRTVGGGEAQLRRRVETVAIPVFQFGMFSDVDLSFSAADDFDFGGRVHTNGNLFLAQGGASGSTLYLRDKVTAVREIIRKYLSNGQPISASGSTRIVKMARAPGLLRDLATTEQSLVEDISSSPNSAWPTLSLSTYNGYIRDGTTGARPLNLPLITTGGANTDLVRRPAEDEDTTNPTLLAERFFNNVSLRILLSDTANDITSLPTVTGTAPVELAGDWLTTPPNNGTAYGPVSVMRPAIALSRGPMTMTTNAVGGATTIPVANTAAFRPAISINGTAFTCTSKTGTTFTGCVGAPAAGNGVVVASGPGIVTTTTAAHVAGAAVITVATTAQFVPVPFFIGGTLVTCNGWTSTSFTGCFGHASNLPSNTTLTSQALTPAGTAVIGGFIKIEMQDTNRVWQDVTMEILNYGISGPNLAGTICTDPTPNAIVRIQRLRDNTSSGGNGSGCSYLSSTSATDHWPNVLYDTREGVFRDSAAADLRLGGVMHYIALDVNNLRLWLAGTGAYNGSSGTSALSVNGFSVYFSDRRNNRDANGNETGEYGFEDVVNPLSGTGAPNNSLDVGEDFNGDSVVQVYGAVPNFNGVYNAVAPGSVAPLDVSARPITLINQAQAKVNRPVLFRRALKLINGGLGNVPTPGFTVASENPVYIQGDYNASTAAGWTGTHAATSVIADAVTLLSSAWRDTNSLASPYAVAGRARSSHTWYRVAIIAGKGRLFPRPGNGEGATFGTDGGAHSFLRYLEGAGGDDTIHYRGSMATFYYHRQAVSPFKCCGGVVYDVPVRDFTFDTDFLDPALLPPLTPVFRDINALGFWQEIRPGK